MSISSRIVARTTCPALLVVALAGCVGPKLAVDKLEPTKVNAAPLVSNTSAVEVGINEKIRNWERLDETLKESIEIALANAKIFGADSSSPYRVEAFISVASQAAMSFGNFNGKLEVVYKVMDDSGQVILEKKVYTEAGSDRWYFSGAARHRRARAVNIAKNVMEFLEALQAHLEGAN